MKKILIVSAILGGVSQVAVASDTGFYAGINLGVGTTQNVPTLGIPNDSVNSSSDFAVGILGGYNINKYLAAELNYVYVGMPQSSISFLGSTVTLNENNSFLTANAKGTLPLNEKFNLVGKFGLGANFASMSVSGSGAATGVSSNSSNNFAILLGVGAEYNLTEHVSFNLMDSYYIVTAPAISLSNTSATPSNFSFGNTNYLSLGMNYSF